MTLDSRFPWRLLALAGVFVLGAAAAPFEPHYASVRRDPANLREGPSYDHRILWVYRHRDYPVKIVGSFDAWRRVKDADGTLGWMHHTQLSDKRTVVFIGFTKSPMRVGDGPRDKIVAYAQPGVVARLKACKLRVCEIEAAGTAGWVDKRNLWGVELSEVFQ
ncbi:MAG: SH3 domain-containing protein [Rhizomicrobium sp.]